MKRTTLTGLLAFAFILCLLAVSYAGAAEDPANKSRQGQSLDKVTGTPRWAILNINNFTNWFRSDGNGSNPPSSGGDGGYYPRGTRWVIYEDGMVWGGKAYQDAALTVPSNQLIRVGGGTYNVGTVPGAIVGTGSSATREAPANADVRIYKIRRDYPIVPESDYKKDAAEYNEVPETDVTTAEIEEVKAQYATDWDQWPVSKGAPYIERNGTAGYQKPPAFNYDEADGPLFTVDSLISGSYDEPGIAGADPNSPADMVIWTVANDLDPVATQGFQGADPLGIEVQYTLWGYKRSDALGQLYFKKTKLINKGGATMNDGSKGFFWIDSMYVCAWSDPDLGSAGDDLAGCDSLLSMGFVYNGNAIDNEFKKYNIPPPAAGYDFLAGPLVDAPGDSAVFGLKRVYDKANLPMTSFAYFSAGSSISDPPFTYEGGLQWYRMLAGFVPDESTAPIRLFPHPPGVVETKFPLSGDPVKQTGFVDGVGEDWSFPPGDRRILLNTGPFTLAPGDTQEIVVGVVGGLGSDRLSSVAVMKFNDRFVQNTYDALFQVPKAPAAPDVKFAELDGKIILEWASNPDRVKQTETLVAEPGTYAFEGYNVYQFPSSSSSLKDAKRLATYDLVTDPTVVLNEDFDVTSGQILQLPVQFGSNSGIKRYFEFTSDAVRDVNKIYNGQEYFLAVTAYSVSQVAGYLPSALESAPQILTVRPKVPFGQVISLALGDTLEWTKTAGASDGQLVPIVINPAALTGHTYRVTFDSTGLLWTLTDVTANQVKLTGQSNQTGNEEYAIVDGVMVKVIGAPNDYKFFQVVATAGGPLANPDMGAFAFNSSGFPTIDGAAAGSPYTVVTAGDGLNDRPNVPNLLTSVAAASVANGGKWGIHTGDVDGVSFNYSFFKSRTTRDGANWVRIVPNDFEIRFTAAGGRANLAFTSGNAINVPFELWNIGVGTPGNTSDDYRMVVRVLDGNPTPNEIFDLDGWDHPISGGDNDPETDWIYFMNPANRTPGTAGYDAWVAAGAPTSGATVGSEVIARIVLVNFNGGSVSNASFPANVNQAMPATGTIFRIISTKPNQVTDVFQFTAPAPAAGVELEKLSTEKVGVFPNPYYAFNAAETNRLIRFVTFNNLPREATVRIFNLAGQLVRTLNKDDNSQFLRWDLTNGDNFPVASGMYIAYIEMTLSDGSKVNKTLKLAVIQEQEILDVF